MSLLSTFSPLLYIKVAPDRLTVRNVKTGAEVAEVPEMAIGNSGRKKAIIAVGAQARAAASAQSAELVNPFSHPRTIVGDFTVAEQLLKAFVLRLQSSSWFAPAPRVVIHPLGSPAGGFTQVERRALREMALGAGASEVVLWVGRELSDQEVQSAEVLKSVGGRQWCLTCQSTRTHNRRRRLRRQVLWSGHLHVRHHWNRRRLGVRFAHAYS